MNDNELYDKASIFSRWEQQGIRMLTPKDERKKQEQIKQDREFRKKMVAKLKNK